jgi:hypothetical protein
LKFFTSHAHGPVGHFDRACGEIYGEAAGHNEGLRMACGAIHARQDLRDRTLPVKNRDFFS